MATEIEHKYLVNINLWSQVTPLKRVFIKQGYIVKDPDKNIRIRIADERAFITIKGKATNASRPEYEYEIPLNDAQELIQNFCSNTVEKTRHYCNFENKIWEVDVFEGLNTGLIIAEIELTSENEEYKKPIWVEQNVSNDFRYTNSNLSIHPFSEW